MSLWNNTKDFLSAPTWYARRCYFDGKDMVKEGKVDLSHAGTQFCVGDAVLYVAEMIDGGEVKVFPESNKVYYVKSIVNGLYEFAESSDPEAATVNAVASSNPSKQMFVLCDSYETTDGGTLDYAIVPVSRNDVLTAKYGKAVNAAGWWRFLNFVKTRVVDGVDKSFGTIHAELLVSLKGDFFAEDAEPESGEPVGDETKDTVLNKLTVKADKQTVKGLSVSVNDLVVENPAKDEKVAAVDAWAAAGDVVIGNGSLDTATLNVTAKDGE